MNCPDFHDRLTDLLAGELTPEAKKRLEDHLAACPACAAAYRAAREALDAATPRIELKAPAALKSRILDAARRAEIAPAAETDAAETASKIAAAATSAPARRPQRRMFFRLTAGALSAAAVVAVALIVGLNTPARAARNCFRQAVASMSEAQTLSMELRIRTTPADNFAYTNPAEEFVPVTIAVDYAPRLRWRIEKLARKAFFDGELIYQWLGDDDGYIQSPNADIMAGLSVLLDPRTLLLREEELAVSTQGATYRIVRAADAVLLTVTCPAQGDYRQSDYMLNTSIAESNTRREYRFDPDNGRLLSARIWAIIDGGERQILDLERIAYDRPLSAAELTARPEGIAWIDLRKAPDGRRLAGIDVEKAGELVLHALAGWDEGVLNEALYFYGPNGRELLREKYAGAVPTSIGKAVQSGEYPGRFIPCKLLLRNGKTQKLMLALRNDTPNGSWVVDGGL